MAYREPGVYLEIINNRPLTGSAPNIVPMIIGEGPKFMDFTDKAVVRSNSGNTDVLPSSKVTAITRVYTVVNGVQTTINPTGNYELLAPNIVNWDPAAPDKPQANSTYYVDYEARPEASQYQAAYITSFDQLGRAYDGMFMKTVSGGAKTTINPVYLGAYLALESGAQGIYVLQIEPADKTDYTVVIATDMTDALNKASSIESVYSIVPMTSDATAVNAVISHCRTMSNPIERKERICFVSKNITAPAATTGIFTSGELDAAAALVSSIQEKRVRVPFVTTAGKVLSDGVEYYLGAEYVCAALAGLAAIIPVSKALTRQKLFNFTVLRNVLGLNRQDKNNMAAAGYIVLEQPGGYGTPISIRHGITTDLSSVENREHSIVVSTDYVAKYIRTALDAYIGTHNIDDFLPALISGTLEACRNSLVRDGIVRDLKLTSMSQDADNPDTLLVTISYLPMYPCNYIDVDLLIE